MPANARTITIEIFFFLLVSLCSALDHKHDLSNLRVKRFEISQNWLIKKKIPSPSPTQPRYLYSKLKHKKKKQKNKYCFFGLIN